MMPKWMGTAEDTFFFQQADNIKKIKIGDWFERYRTKEVDNISDMVSVQWTCTKVTKKIIKAGQCISRNKKLK